MSIPFNYWHLREARNQGRRSHLRTREVSVLPSYFILSAKVRYTTNNAILTVVSAVYSNIMATQRITEMFVRNLNQQLTGQSVVVKPNELSSALVLPAWKQR